ncbi:hypothetical protein [Kiloniella antarctica]|uniref:Uncharacterized protein n=1 Tax=Kiloniella antarctica TaxID=1550907 RepID=A0ABW5BLZ3_9PROT
MMKLRALTATRSEQAGMVEIQLDTYAEELGAYAADCTAYALKQAGKDKWWPTWSELLVHLNEVDQVRKILTREMEEQLSIVKSSHQRGQMSSFGDLTKAEG